MLRGRHDTLDEKNRVEEGKSRRAELKLTELKHKLKLEPGAAGESGGSAERHQGTDGEDDAVTLWSVTLLCAGERGAAVSPAG